MSTVIIDPRPELIAEEAATNQPVLADSFLRAWQTVGNSYELLTTGTAPGNAGRTVALVHDHGVAGPGAILAQAPMRWQGNAEIGDTSSPAISHPLGLAYTFAWASLVIVYADQETSLCIFGTTGGGASNRPATVPGGLVMELNGAATPLEVSQSNDPGSWVISAGLGLLVAGTHTLALRIDSYAGVGESWAVTGAEVWAALGDQIRLPE